jgi:large subunit ribosomal protein L30
LAARLRITWKKSAIGYKNNQKRTIEALGLKRLGQSVEQADNRAVRGMITKVRHLVEVTEVDGTSPSSESEESKE